MAPKIAIVFVSITASPVKVLPFDHQMSNTAFLLVVLYIRPRPKAGRGGKEGYRGSRRLRDSVPSPRDTIGGDLD